MILILTDGTTSRHRYIFGYLLRTYCGIDCTFQHVSAGATQPTGLPVIAYLENPVEGSFHIRPQGILSATGIPEEPAVVIRSDRSPFFYPCQDADFPFDVFGASFYLLSRAEEYHGHPPDTFGRYDHQYSLSFRYGFLDLPLIDVWMSDLRKLLVGRFPSLPIKAPVFEFRPSYDIDFAWAWRARGFSRTIWGICKSMVAGRFRDVVGRINVLRGVHQDPYDSYDRLDHLHIAHGCKCLYFFLLATSLKGVDRNVDPRREDVQDLIRRHAGSYTIGMHPSWQSGDDPAVFQAEKARLENIIGCNVNASRQHYLRMHLPDSYRRLIEYGITDDHSMGYGAVNGFRASVSRPYPWYDLHEERETTLIVHPFCFMDATAFHELGMSPEDALHQLSGYLQAIRQYGGCMMTIFHNSMLGTDPLYDGWYDMYVRFLDMISDGSFDSSGVLSG
jgi:hypothetical protein